MLKFIHICLNHHNKVCRSLLLSKVNCKKNQCLHLITTIYVLYNLSHSDWYIDTSQLLGKVQMKRQQETKCCSSRIIIELWEIRDGLASCEKITDSNICKLIDSICLE